LALSIAAVGVVMLALVVTLAIFTASEKRPPAAPETLEQDYREAREAFGATGPTPATGPNVSSLPADASPADQAAIDATLRRLGAAYAAGQRAQVIPLVDIDYAVRLLDALGAFGDLPPSDRKPFIFGFRTELNKSGLGSLRGWVRQRVYRHKPLTPDEVVAYVRVGDAVGESDEMCWWFHKSATDGNWRVYDFQDLLKGDRWSERVLDIMRNGASSDTNVAAGRKLTEAIALRAKGDYQGVIKLLSQLEGQPIAPTVERARLIALADAQIETGDPAAALRGADRLAKIRAAMPTTAVLRSRAHYAAGSYAKANDAADDAIAIIGVSPYCFGLKGRALEKLGRRDEALAAFAAALDADPDSEANLADFTRLLPPERKSEAAARFAKSSRTPRLLRAARDQLKDSEDAQAISALQRAYAYKEAHPE
jgi:tetratricopeptide (TPR) repeat protein